MSILSHPDNDDHDFGRAVFHVGDFVDWLRKAKLRIYTIPALEGFEFVQVASLLQAIERAAGHITDAEAQAIVDANPFLAADRMARINPRWLVGAEAHRQWREVIKQALVGGKLVMLDYTSKLPLQTMYCTPRASDDTGAAWKSKAQAMAVSLYQEKPAKKNAIAFEISKAFQELKIRSTTGRPLTADNIARQALTPWTAPRMARENKKRA